MTVADHSVAWRVRDLPVLQAVDRLTTHRPHLVDVPTLAIGSGLRREEVLDALDALEALRAVRVERVVGQEPRVAHVTAIGSTMLAMQDDDDTRAQGS